MVIAIPKHLRDDYPVSVEPMRDGESRIGFIGKAILSGVTSCTRRVGGRLMGRKIDHLNIDPGLALFLQNMVQQYQTDKEQFATILVKLYQDMSGLRQEIGRISISHTRELKEMDAEIFKARKKFAEVEKKFQESTARVSELEAIVARGDQSLKVLEEKLALETNARKFLEQQLSHSKAHIESLQRELKKSREESTALSKEIVRTRKNFEAVIFQNRTLKEKNEQLEGEIEQKKHQMKDLSWSAELKTYWGPYLFRYFPQSFWEKTFYPRPARYL
jgi:predicted  nucleic acid-binding Zn-ribbon protein